MLLACYECGHKVFSVGIPIIFPFLLVREGFVEKIRERNFLLQCMSFNHWNFVSRLNQTEHFGVFPSFEACF